MLPVPRESRVLIDSGATRYQFDFDLSTHLALILQTCPLKVTQGTRGDANIYVHDLTLYVHDGPVKITAGFKENLSLACWE